MLNPLATHAGTRRLITAAGTAPSVHNTQPWRFVARRREYIELHADPDRWLKVADPRGRPLRISCGAALLNLRLALRVSGHRPLIWSARAAGDDPSTLLAAVRPASAAPASTAEHDLYDAIKFRRTNRQPFTDAPIPAAVADELGMAARLEGAGLVFLRDPASVALLEEVAAAEETLTGNRAYRTELAQWTSGQSHSDGMPPYVQGPRPIGDLVPVRDLARVTRERVRFEAHPHLAVLTTPGDDPADWLRAGQALQRVLLVATPK
jgi:nitroreductase